MSRCEGRKFFDHLVLTHFVKRSIAVHTPAKWGQLSSQIKPPQHFEELFLRECASRAIPVHDLSALQQFSVSGEKYALLLTRNTSKMLVLIIVSIVRVKAKEAQIPRQATEMRVEDKFHGLQPLRTDSRLMRKIDRHKQWIHTYSVAICKGILEPDRLAVDQNQIDLWMRYTQRFNRVLNGGATRERVTEGTELAIILQEEIQFSVKPERYTLHIRRATPRIAPLERCPGCGMG